jgi:arylsulfatase A-like enzyme
MWWPGRIPAGAVCREVASTIDLLPTLATLAGAPLPTDRVIDGRYIWPLMAGAPGAKSPHEGFFYYTSGPKPVLQAVRSGRWKLRTGALYDLENDVAETQDVAAQHPAVAQRLFEMMKSFDESLRRTSRPVGRIPAP